MITEAQTAHIEYCSVAGETSDRYIIPMSVPKDSIRAIDVTDLDEEARQLMERRVAEYKEYMGNILKSAFTFENWVDHTYNTEVNPKWRSFKVNNTTVLD